jgi:DNA-binding NtrC family response regulator
MPARIVIVDDEQTFADSLTSALRAAGYDSANYIDPIAALEALAEAQRVELLITRVEFAKGRSNGHSLALMTRRRLPGVKILFVAKEVYRESAIAIGEWLPRTTPLQVIVDKAVELLSGP